MTRRHDIRRVNTRKSYRTEEVADLLHVTKVTVYHWIRQGLELIDSKRPYLIHGSRLTAFLSARNKPYEPLRPGQIYCVACKCARAPAGGRVEWITRAPTNGDMVGECPECGRRIFRRVRLDRLEGDRGRLMLVHEGDTTTMIGGGDHPHTLHFGGSAG